MSKCRPERTALYAECRARFIETFLATAWEPMRHAARQGRYALALHGSLARDIDMLAVPWAENPYTPGALASSIEAVCKTLYGGEAAFLHPEHEDKPHGRRAYTIYLVHSDVYIDLSIMPPAPEEAPDHE